MTVQCNLSIIKIVDTKFYLQEFQNACQKIFFRNRRRREENGSKQYWGQCLALGFGSDFLCVQQINLIYTNIDFNQYEIHFFYNRMFDG